MKQLIKAFIHQLPYIKGLYQQVENFKKNALYPAGHYYFPIVSVEDIENKATDIWQANISGEIKGINLNKDAQCYLIRQLSAYYPEIPFDAHKTGTRRYQFENDLYSYTV
jgi:hypothetical protein